MKVIGIIGEFNPFHNGHARILAYAREALSADYVIAVQSGNYVQRGEPALFHKFLRAEAALLCGADLVLELPCVFSCAAAGDFAEGAVSVLSAAGVADTLLFGTENAEALPELSRIAELLSHEPSDFRALLSGFLKSGMSYPAARAAALSRFGLDASFLLSPNNLLACEYLKALSKKAPEIKPAALLRSGDSYHAAFPKDQSFTSATALRRIFLSEDSASALSSASPFLPEAVLPLYEKALTETHTLGSPELFSGLLNDRLLSECEKEAPDFTRFLDVSPEISMRLLRNALRFGTFSGRIDAIKTRQYTRSRISRALLHIVLGITDELLLSYKAEESCPYLRVLGFRKASAPLLSEIKRHKKAPLITKAADHKELLKHDIYVSNLYYALCGEEKNEYERSPVIL